jgi:hypothetical protein
MNRNTIAASRGGEFTSAPVAAPVRVAAPVEPEFIPMPPPGTVCPYSGLKRGALYQLANDGLIRTVAIRRKGTTRGRRLIVASTLRDYLRRLDMEQNGIAKSASRK